MSDFEKIFAFKKSRFGSFYSVKTTYFAIFVFFKEHDFVLKISFFHYVSDFETKKNTMRQIFT